MARRLSRRSLAAWRYPYFIHQTPVDSFYFQTLAYKMKNIPLKSFRMEWAIYSHSATAMGRRLDGHLYSSCARLRFRSGGPDSASLVLTLAARKSLFR